MEAEQIWEKFIVQLNVEQPIYADKKSKTTVPHKNFLGSIEHYKAIFLRSMKDKQTNEPQGH